MSTRFNKAIAIITAVLVIGLLGIGLWVFFVENNPAANNQQAGGTQSSLMDGAQNSAMNAIIDASGIKTQLEDALTSRSADIAAATGLPQSQVNAAINDLDIKEWTATTLPNNAHPENSFSSTVEGVDASITTYSDPSYVTVSAYGQDITMKIPASAQQYTNYLEYLG